MTVVEREVTADTLRAAYQAGRRARFHGRRRESPYRDDELDFAWLCGWDAADRKIYELWRG